MLAAYFSPLAPAAALLLGAFILPLIAFQLPVRWRSQPWLRSLGAPFLVGLAVLALLGVRLTFGADSAGAGLELLSGWNFASADTVAALTVRADTLSLPFLLLTILIMLAVTLATPIVVPALNKKEENISDLVIWLALGACACLLFVSANGLTLIYIILAFDVLTMFYWLQRGQRDLSIARVFLGVFTAVGLALANLTPTNSMIPAAAWLGLLVWLRLGLYPFWEVTVQTHWRDYSGLTYLSLSLGVGIYLAIRIITSPLPGFITWLVVILMLLNGVLAWLAEPRPLFLARLLLVEILLMLLAVPLDQGVIAAHTVGLALSLVVLWITPRLGRPRLNEAAWSWPYFPALAATLTLLGLPLSLGWPARTEIYAILFNSNKTALTLLIIILAEALAWSSLLRYWLLLWQGDEVSERRSLASVVVMVPFLIPGLAPAILTTITDTQLPPADLNQPAAVWAVLAATTLGALGLGYFRPRLLDRLLIAYLTLAEWLTLRWLAALVWAVINFLSKFLLRTWALLEGQHYLGWALFAALVGALVIVLSF
jgi:hypothetical protein